MKNIISIFAQASIAELSEGMNWYSTAQSGALLLAQEHGISLVKAAGVIAALSPNLRWELNLKAADTVIRSYRLGIDPENATCPAYKANRKKAYQVLDCNGEDNTVRAILNGQKITSFYGCIMGHDDVCIDGHAKNIWAGERMVLKNNSINKTQYQMLTAEYRMATEAINNAYKFNLTPMQVQAVTWVVWRRIHKI